MAMRISFSTGTYYHRPLSYSLQLARELGYDGVEWVVTPGYLLAGLAPVRRAFADAGVHALSVHPPLYRFPGWSRKVARRTTRLGALARHLGSELFVVHTPNIRSLYSIRAQEYEAALDLGQMAAGTASGLSVETGQYVRRNGKRRSPWLLDDLRAVVELCQRHHAGITLDTCHAGANREDLLAAYAIVRPLLRNIHLSDVVWQAGRPLTHRMPGEGELPLARLLQTLAADGYDGLVTVELHPAQAGAWSRAQAARRMGQALAFVRQHTVRTAATLGQAEPASEAALEE
jgi:sugar phosphate isomerase/epimerase